MSISPDASAQLAKLLEQNPDIIQHLQLIQGQQQHLVNGQSLMHTLQPTHALATPPTTISPSDSLAAVHVEDNNPDYNDVSSLLSLRCNS